MIESHETPARRRDCRRPARLPFDVAVLAQDERHLRRKVITLAHGDRVLVDFAEPLVLEDRDVLVLEDGRHAEIVAADEELLEIRGRDAVHLAEPCLAYRQPPSRRRDRAPSAS